MVRLRAGLIAFAVGLLGSVAVTAADPSHAVATASSAPGVCKDAGGVTVVVDMSALGGSVVVRCAQGSGFTGLDALRKAGFSVAGTQRFGNAYVCRIQGRPSANETLPISGNPSYEEKCVNTPPPTAYWGYWYAKNGGGWTYSNTGASGHTVVKGGFEGWAFALNRAGDPPRPAFTPTRPKAPAQPAPTTSDPTSQPPEPGDNDGGGGGSTGGSGDEQGDPSSSPTEGPKATGAKGDGDKQGSDKGDGRKGDKKASGDEESSKSTEPADDTITGAAGDVTVTGELPPDPSAAGAEDSGGSATPALVGLGLLVVLGGGAGITAWRRSHRG